MGEGLLHTSVSRVSDLEGSMYPSNHVYRSGLGSVNETDNNLVMLFLDRHNRGNKIKEYEP